MNFGPSPLLLLALLAPGELRAATTGGPCKLRFTPSTGKVITQRVVTVKGATVREPVQLALIRVVCTRRETKRSCLARAEARARKRHPGRRLESSLVEPKGRPRRAECSVLHASDHKRPCKLTEGDEACKQRVLREARRRVGAGGEVTAVLTGPDGGVEAVIQVDGKRRRLRFSDFDPLAAHIRKLSGRGKRVMLISAERRRDRARRRVLVTIQRTRPRKLPDSQRLLLVWRPPAGVGLPRALQQLHEQTERQGLNVLRFEPQTSGVVELELACPR